MCEAVVPEHGSTASACTHSVEPKQPLVEIWEELLCAPDLYASGPPVVNYAPSRFAEFAIVDAPIHRIATGSGPQQSADKGPIVLSGPSEDHEPEFVEDLTEQPV